MCRNNSVKKAVSLLLVLLLIFGITGCGNSSENQENKDSKTVVVGVADLREIGMLDALYGAGDILHQELIYEPLVVFGENGKIQPGLAEDWKISADGKEYTFYLQKGVKFSDGSDFNADAVLFNVDRWNGASSTATLDVVNNLVKAEKINDYEVKMTFSKSYYPYLTELSYPRPLRMMSPNSVDDKGEFTKPIGTGRWMVESYDKNESILVANPHYNGEKAQIEKIVVKLITDPQARLMAMESGEVDFLAAPVSSENISAIEKADKLSVLEADGTATYHFMMNYENPILQDINVRKAINYAIDKDSIVTNLLDGHAEAAKGLFSEKNPYVTAENNLGYEFSTEKAQKLLKEAGYADSDGDGILEKDGASLRLNLVFQSEEFPDWKPVCEYIASELKKVGIEINLKLQETNAYYDSIWTTRDFDLIMYRTYADSWNPNGFLSSLYYPPKDGKSVAWNDAELNALLEEVLASTEEAQRQQLYDKIFKRMYDEAMCVPLYYPQNLYVYNDRLGNLELAPTSYELLKWEKIQIK